MRPTPTAGFRIIGLDLAKHVFQAHGVGEGGEVVLRRQLRRSELLKFFQALPPCLVGMEACASAHYWARQLAALVVEFLEPLEAVPAIAEHFARLADIAELFGQFQQANLGPDDLLFFRHRGSPSPPVGKRGPSLG